MERQYQSNGFGKFPGLKATPGQVTQSKLVKMIIGGFTVDHIRKKLPMLSGIAIATTWVYINRQRTKKGLKTDQLKTLAELMQDKNNGKNLPPENIQNIARSRIGQSVSSLSPMVKNRLKSYYDLSAVIFEGKLKQL